jgi:hypothetical protein
MLVGLIYVRGIQKYEYRLSEKLGVFDYRVEDAGSSSTLPNV